MMADRKKVEPLLRTARGQIDGILRMVEENQVRKLNADKQPVTGALAENYVLKKTE